jgi:hypothetical protein
MRKIEINKWIIRLNQLDKFICIHKRRPLCRINKEKVLHHWLKNQINHSKLRIQIMHNQSIYEMFIEFKMKHYYLFYKS